MEWEFQPQKSGCLKSIAYSLRQQISECLPCATRFLSTGITVFPPSNKDGFWAIYRNYFQNLALAKSDVPKGLQYLCWKVKAVFSGETILKYRQISFKFLLLSPYSALCTSWGWRPISLILSNLSAVTYQALNLPYSIVIVCYESVFQSKQEAIWDPWVLFYFFTHFVLPVLGHTMRLIP